MSFVSRFADWPKRGMVANLPIEGGIVKDDTVMQLEALEAVLAGDWPAAASILERLPGGSLKQLTEAALQLSELTSRARSAQLRETMAAWAEVARDAPAFQEQRADSPPDWNTPE